MYLRSVALSLLASTALTTVCHAQTAPAQTAAAQPSAPTADFGTIKAQEAPKPVLKQTGLTASPTDFAEQQNKANAAAAAGQAGPQTTGIGSTPRPVSNGGVTGQDLGGGYMIEEEAKKTRSTVTRDAIDKQSPASNPYQMIHLLPGVVQASPDNTGLVGGNMTMRGLNSDHLGLTIEGMPVNDSGNYALFPQEYVDSENIEQISIAQGSQELDSPHIGAAGGVINLYMRDPSKEAGGLVGLSIGSDNLLREFIRVESGQVGPVRAFLSYSHLSKDHWRGPGEDERHHVDFKTVWDISPGNTIRFSAMYNEAVNNFYTNPSLAQFNTHTVPENLAQLPASFFAGGATDQGAGNATNYYDYRVNPFKNLILSAPSNFKISENLKFDTIPYFWFGFGNGGGTATMNESAGMFWGNVRVTNVDYNGDGALNDRIQFYNPSVTETYRPGIVNKLTYTVGDHKIVAGHWLEYAHHRQTGPYQALNPNGTVSDYFDNGSDFRLPASAICFKSGTNTVVACPTGPMNRRDQLTTTLSNMFFIGDSWKVTPRLTLDFGVKQAIVQREVENYLPGSHSGSLHDSATLPTAGLSYKLNENNTVFAGLATSFRSAPNFSVIDSFANTAISGSNPPANAVTPANPIPPEYGKSVEIGHRYQGPLFATSISAFLGHYENYQVSTRIQDPTGGTGQFNITINSGDVLNYGINAEIGTRPIYNFRPYLSAELLHTEMLDNLEAATTAGGRDFLPTKGNNLPAAPGYSFGAGLDYDDGHWFANIGYKYFGEQYSTFMNDQTMPAFGRVDAGVGYRFSDIGFMKQPEIKLNLYNLANARQLVGVNSIQANAVQTTGVNNGTISPSGTPNYFLGEDFSAVLTFRSGF